MTKSLSNVKIDLKSDNRIKIIARYYVEEVKKQSMNHQLTLQFAILSPLMYKKCSLSDLFNDIITCILSPLTALQSVNVIWSYISISVFGHELEKSFFQRLPIRIYGLNKSTVSTKSNTPLIVRIQYFNSRQTSRLKIYGVLSVYVNNNEKKMKNEKLITKQCSKVVKVFNQPIKLKKSGLVIHYVKSVPKNSQLAKPIMPLFVTIS